MPDERVIMKPLLSEQDFERAAKSIGCEVAAIKAVCQVEAPNGGFLPDGRPTILFERHKFSQFSGGKFDASNPDISNPKAGGYGAAGANQHERLGRAAVLDRDAALKAASWGKFQIMGFNFGAAGFKDLQSFINSMYRSEGAQLDAFVAFIKTEGLADELRDRRWADFARRYNGPSYAINRYDTKLAAAYAALKR